MFPEPQVFTEKEVRAFRKDRDDYARELSSVQDRVRRCREQLEELERNESRLADLLWASSRALTPVARAPADILLEIFLHCLPNRWDIEFDPSEAPILLTHVCRRWRGLAMGFASLWKAFKVKPCVTAESRDFGLELSAEWLKRAQQAPIRLQFVVPEDFQGSVHTVLPRLIQPNPGTFITVLSLIQPPFRDIVALGPGLLPALQRLTLYVEVPPDRSHCRCINHGPIQAFRDCPSLISVALKSSFCGSNLHPHIILPLNQLAHFIEYGRPYHTSFTHQLPILQRLRILPLDLNAEDLWLPWIQPELPTDAGSTMVVMGNLKTLRIHTINLSSIRELASPKFFFKFEFPNLERLIVSWGLASMVFSPKYPSHEDLFLRKIRSFRSLTALSLRAYHIPADPLQRILQATPLLTNLDIEQWEDSGEYNHILDILTPGSQTSMSEYLIPLLQTFSVHVQHDWSDEDPGEEEPFDEVYLENFIESRLARSGEENDVSKEASRNLKEIVVFAGKDSDLRPERGFVQKLQEFVPRGLRLELRVKKEHEWTTIVPEVSDWAEEADIQGWHAQDTAST